MLILRPIFGRGGRPSGGPLVNRWAALAIPFSLATALVGGRGLWRLAAAGAVGLCFAAAFGTDVRAAPGEVRFRHRRGIGAGSRCGWNLLARETLVVIGAVDDLDFPELGRVVDLAVPWRDREGGRDHRA